MSRFVLQTTVQWDQMELMYRKTEFTLIRNDSCCARVVCLVVVHHCITNVLRELLITLPSSSPSSSSSSSSSCQPCIQLVVRGTVHETSQKGTFIPPPCGHSHSPQKGTAMRTLTLSPEGTTMRTLTLCPEGYHHAQTLRTTMHRHSHSPQKGTTIHRHSHSPQKGTTIHSTLTLFLLWNTM